MIGVAYTQVGNDDDAARHIMLTQRRHLTFSVYLGSSSLLAVAGVLAWILIAY